MAKWFTVQNSIGSIWMIRANNEQEALEEAESMVKYEEALECAKVVVEYEDGIEL